LIAKEADTLPLQVKLAQNLGRVRRVSWGQKDVVPMLGVQLQDFSCHKLAGAAALAFLASMCGLVVAVGLTLYNKQ
jgi:hypothetical protein